MKKVNWLRVYFSPFKFIIPRLYIGKIRIGTPIFLPRKWVKCKDKPGYKKPIKRRIGFDFVGLGWKTKWNEYDVRHEWSPVWSFVFFKWQIALIFRPAYELDYWECWLIYRLFTTSNKTTVDRIKEAKNLYPCEWIKKSSDNKEKEEICYWDLILKNKWKRKIDGNIIIKRF